MEQSLGKRIMINRKRLCMTQDQLAEKLGVSPQAVSKWENDQSCPDISTLPYLAEIFGISIDMLLGHTTQETVHQGQVVIDEEDAGEPEGVHIQNGKFNISFDGGKRSGIWLALLVLSVGALYLISQIFSLDISFWDILWPVCLTVFGISGLYPKFSFFRLACSLFGGYFLIANFNLLPAISLDGGIIFAICILLFGLSLLSDALKKPKKPFFRINHNDDDSKETLQFQLGEDSFDYTASFGECTQFVDLANLRSGSVHCSFGEYTLDLTGISSVSASCSMEAHCSFGELILRVPSRFAVHPNSSTAFANVSVNGHPDSTPEGIIQLEAHANFGEIIIEYV